MTNIIIATIGGIILGYGISMIGGYRYFKQTFNQYNDISFSMLSYITDIVRETLNDKDKLNENLYKAIKGLVITSTFFCGFIGEAAMNGKIVISSENAKIIADFGIAAKPIDNEILNRGEKNTSEN